MIDRRELVKLLEQVKSGKVDIAKAITKLESVRFEELGFAKVDHGRRLRCGFPEVIFAQGKTAKQIAAIAKKLIDADGQVLITRLDKSKAAEVKKSVRLLVYSEEAKAAYYRKSKTSTKPGILIVTAGTSDIPVAEEAAITCEAMGLMPDRFYDAGVAGIHRLIAGSEKLREAKIVIVVAGMEGALPSVVGGMVNVPVIAVPTSVGYGASFGGVAALLSMLNSCASGVTVVNIDNGYGAAIAAMRLLNSLEQSR